MRTCPHPRLALATWLAVLLAGAVPARAQYFREAPALTVPGSAPVTAAAAGDFNGDGIADLAVDYKDARAGGGLRVFLGLGGGAFGPPIVQPGVPGWRQVASGDLNEDGKLDLFVASGIHTLLLGDGAGHFAIIGVAAGNSEIGAAIADVDRDGHQDLIGYDRPIMAASRVLVYRGNGAGGFAPPAIYAMGFQDGAMAVGDFNGDGAVDVAATWPEAGRVYVRFNDGSGLFLPQVFFPVGVGAEGLAAGDLNGDGRIDLVAANPDTEAVSVLMATASGTFAPPVHYVGPGEGLGRSSLTVADMDQDGRLDVVATGGGAWIYRGNGSGGLAAPARYVATGLAAVADLDGDGRRDLAVGNRILVNRGNLDFAAPRQYGVGKSPRAVAAADLNHDGRADLVTANQDSHDVSVLLGNGDGTFGGTTSIAAGINPQGLALADFNADGHTDIAATNRGSGNVSVLLGNGAGAFGAAPFVPTGSQPDGIAAGDLDGDGRMDLAVGMSTGVAIRLGAGNGTFTPGVTQTLPGPAHPVVVTSVNADTRPDLVAGAEGGPSGLATMLGIGGGQFLPAAFPPAASTVPAANVAPLDFDADTSTDLGVASGLRPLILRGNGAGGFTDVPVVSITRVTPALHSRALAAADFTRDGNPDLLGGSTSLLVGTGTSFAVFERPVGMAAKVADLATADFDGDGHPDVAAVTQEGSVVEVLLNQAAAPGADLSVALTHSPDPAVPQSPLTYTITATNHGPLPAKGVIVALYLPNSGSTPQVPPPNCTLVGPPASLFCALGDIAVSGTASVAVEVVVTLSNGTLTARADVDAVEPRDIDPFDNEVIDVAVIGPASDLSVSIDDSVDPVAPGSPFIYTLQLANAGPAPTLETTLRLTLPGTLTFLSASHPTCSFFPPELTCAPLDPIPAGQSVTVTVDVMAGSFTAATSVVAGACVNDLNLANNQASEETRIDLGTGRELLHGTRLHERVPAGSPDRVYFIREEPRSSYEVIVDGLAGDVATPGGSVLLERLDELLSPVQAATPVGTGPGRSLRWQNSRATAVTEAIRVRSTGCGTACDAGDLYRIRAYETTGRIARFRNLFTQVTVVLLQNPLAFDVHGTIWIWDEQGAPIASRTFTIGPRQSLRVDTSTIVPGQQGTLTVTHDAPYGSLAGKSVGLEPGTGFSVDTMMLTRPR